MSDERNMGSFPEFASVSEMQGVIDRYFDDCRGEPVRDKNGEILFDKNGNPLVYGAKPPTITGLALALGFTGRQALLQYQAEEAFRDTLARAKSRVEQYAEERLFDKDGTNAAKFTLANNFEGWKDKQPEMDANQAVTIHVELVDD